MPEPTKVFISYSHDSDVHAARVLDLANTLRRDGIDAILDQYLHRGPEEGWPLWMDNNIGDANNFVLMVCTDAYLRRVTGKEKPGEGLGVRWEGKLIYNRIYHDKPSGSRFIPILLPGSKPAYIPTPVLGHNRYAITSFHHADSGYDGLYRHLVDKPRVIVPELGTTLGEPVVWNVPYPRNPNFTGREVILKQLETALGSGMPTALSQAIAGLGGVGKTQTAVEYAYRHRDRYRAVLWVRADTETSLVSGYRELAEVLGLPEKNESDSNKVTAAVRRWLGREPGYLLILDNADDPSLVKPYLPPDPKGHVLLTSRAHNFDILGIRKPIGLPVLTPDEALAFLLKRTDREGPLDPAEQDAARTLAEEVGYLPLALEQAAAYMKVHEEPFSVYLAAYRALRLKLLDEMGPVVGEYPETVRTTWKRSFDAIAEASPASIALLRLSAFFAPDAIPYELILEGTSELGEPLAPALASPAGGDYALNKILTPLARHSLVRRDPEARTYSVHRLVQAVLLDELTAATRKDLAERAVKALDRTFPHVEYATWPRCERLVPHALAAIEREDLRIEEAAWLLNHAAFYLSLRAQYPIAESSYQKSATILGGLFGEVSLQSAKIYRNLAELYARSGQLKKCEEKHKQALKIRIYELGYSHVDTSQSLNGLANLYTRQKRYEEAEALYQRALEIRESELGRDDLLVAATLNVLAQLYDRKKQCDKAEPLYKRALEIRNKKLPATHPDVAASLNNLGRLCRAQGKYKEAEKLLKRALRIRKEVFGLKNRDTAASYNNWAALYHDQRRYWRAEPLYRKSLALREEVLGPDHPEVARTLENLGNLLSQTNRIEEAKALYQRARAIRSKGVGPHQGDRN